MGNRTSTVNVNEELNGSIDDIFKLIFRPDDKNTYALIRAHIINYPTSLDRIVYCTGLDKNDDYDTKYAYYGTPLLLATRYSKKYSSVEIVKLLIEIGANVNQRVKYPTYCNDCHSSQSMTPLIIACIFADITSNKETIDILLKAGANVNMKGCCKTPLLQVCLNLCKCNIDVIQTLLENEANTDIYYNHKIWCYRHVDYEKRTAYDVLTQSPTTQLKLKAKEILDKHCLK